MAAERTRYRFGPLERRGILLGWRGGQIASVASGVVIAVLVLRSEPTLSGVVLAVGAVSMALAFAVWPIGGRTAEEWTPTVFRWSLGGLGGRTQRSPMAHLGRRAAIGKHGWQHPPTEAGPLGTGPPGTGPPGAGPAGSRSSGAFAGLSILSVQEPRALAASAVGIIHDRRARTYTAVLRVAGHSFALLGAEEKDRRVSGWAAVLSSLARQASVIHRLQWIATGLPDDGRAVNRFLAERSPLDPSAPARRSYEGLLAEAGASTTRHQVLMTMQVRADRTTARALRAAGGGDRGACAVLLRELALLRRRLGEADVLVEEVLGPASVAIELRKAVEPGPGVEGEACSWPWPMATTEEWGRLRTDGTWHVTYWVAEWPRVEVGPEFLGPILLGPLRRSLSVVMEPVPPAEATRRVEQARTADLADGELRRRGGFLATARRAREVETVARRESELADGHATFRFSGYLTVTAATPELLEEACAATEQAAGQARLELRRLYGDQLRAFACVLPLGRGLS